MSNPLDAALALELAAHDATAAGHHYDVSLAFTDAARLYAEADMAHTALAMRGVARRAMDRHTAGMPVLRNAVIAEIGA